MKSTDQPNSRRSFLKAATAATTSSVLIGLPSLALSSKKTRSGSSKAVPAISTEGNGRVVLITGTSSGFGRLMALTFARNGWETVATMRNLRTRNAAVANELRQVARRENLKLRVVEINVDKDRSVARGVLDALSLTNGNIDVLINNAGYSVSGPVEFQPIEVMQSMYNTNVFGAQRMMRAVLPVMRAKKCGLILQLSTRIGRMGMPRLGTYTSTKFALEGLYATLRYELAPLGIDVALLEPGIFPTPFHPKTTNALRDLLEQMNKSATERQRIPDYSEHLKRFEAIAARIAATDPSVVNPQTVADTALRVAAMAPGSRPFRTPLGTDQEVELLTQFNALNDQVERTFISLTGFTDWLTLSNSNCLVV